VRRAERWALLVLGAAQVALRIVGALHHDVDSDEPQHLHVAWGWIHGLLPYRDVFDNHSPLFSMIMAPVLQLVGQRPDVVVIMRFAMFPLIGIALACLGWIAWRLFSPRVAWWTVAVAGVNPLFMQSSIEYRTDQLWMAAWLGALAVMVSGKWHSRRGFGTGLLLGTAVVSSMKTSLLIVALLVSWLAVTVAGWSGAPGAPGPSRSGRLRAAAACLAGLVLLPGLLAAYFAARGVWGPLVHGVIGHNLQPGLGFWSQAPYRPLLMPVLALPLGLVAFALYHATPDRELGARRALVLLTTGIAHAALESIWPLVTREDQLPLLPVTGMYVTALLLALPAGVARAWPPARILNPAWLWVPAALAATLETAISARVVSALQDHTAPQREMLEQVLTLTRDSDPVMDIKGESVFRRRPYFLGIETITEERLKRGLIADDIAESLVVSRTPVVVQMYSPVYPLRDREFIARNYLDAGWVRVLGRRLDPDSVGSRAPLRFDLEVPQRYALVSSRGPARGWLDGRRWDGARELAVGPHVYLPAEGEGRVLAVWADALGRPGFRLE
jgi:hypothetical protein